MIFSCECVICACHAPLSCFVMKHYSVRRSLKRLRLCESEHDACFVMGRAANMSNCDPVSCLDTQPLFDAAQQQLDSQLLSPSNFKPLTFSENATMFPQTETKHVPFLTAFWL